MRTRVSLLVLTALLSLGIAAPAVAAKTSNIEIVRVYHQAVNPISVVGTGIGTVRTFFIPIAVNGRAANNQYVTGSLTTLAENVVDGLEVRASNLVFVFGEEANQLVVGGISLYPPTGATLAPGEKTTRPVLGGSGIYAGARGQVISTNLGANGWTHVFQLQRMPR